MKISIDVDCTPEEARTFMGLPDVKPLQDAYLQKMQDNMDQAMQSLGPEAVFKTVFPAHLEGIENLQKAFWSSFTGNGSSDKK